MLALPPTYPCNVTVPLGLPQTSGLPPLVALHTHGEMLDALNHSVESQYECAGPGHPAAASVSAGVSVQCPTPRLDPRPTATGGAGYQSMRGTLRCEF